MKLISVVPLPPLDERAYEIARSGECETIDDIKEQLQQDGYTRMQIEEHFGSRILRANLETLCRLAKEERG